MLRRSINNPREFSAAQLQTSQALASMYGPVLAVLAEPTRLQILSLLASCPRGMYLREIREALGFYVSEPTISQHVRKLEQAGLVTKQCVGRRKIVILVTARMQEVALMLSALLLPPADRR